MGIKVFFVFVFISSTLRSQIGADMKVYLIPGQGSDFRIFQNLTFPDGTDTIHLQYLLPEENEDMSAFALRMSNLVDTTENFILIGVSLGGMVATEMTEYIHPEKVIIISSAKSETEIPPFYKSMKSIPLYRYVAPSVFKSSTYLLQPIYEYDHREIKSVCNQMLHDKEGLFIKRAVDCIVHWDRTDTENEGINIIHIQGDRDQTLPIQNMDVDYTIKGGSHFMVLTKAAEISEIIKSEITPYLND